MNYQPPLPSARTYDSSTAYKPKLLLIWGLAALVLLALSWEMFLQDSSLSSLMSRRSELVEIHLTQQLPKQLPPIKKNTPILTTDSTPPSKHATESHWHSYLVQENDTFSHLIEGYQLDPNGIYTLMKNKQARQYLTHLRPNHKISFYIEQDHLKNILYQLSPTQALVIHLKNKHYVSKITRRIEEAELENASGTIHSNLYDDAKSAGMNAKLIMKLAQIFSWKVNFAKSLRPGDRFSVLYEKRYLPDNQVQKGDIIAASMTVHGKTYDAVRYVDQHGNTHYYTPKGRSLESAFLRAPVHYTRISSPFSLRRKHPVLGIVRPHYGVDLAAPRGTPIRAASNGIVSFIGKRHGYGNIVILHHANHYSTRYAHMSRFNRKLHVGSHVKRGQTIGYVGMTGLADGPHLHYEVRIRNKPKNPMTVKLPSAASIPKKERASFVKQAQYYIDLLNENTSNAGAA